MASSDEAHPWRGKTFKDDHIAKTVDFEAWNQAEAKYLGNWLHDVEKKLSGTKYALSENN
jgi:hypothetical protein